MLFLSETLSNHPCANINIIFSLLIFYTEKKYISILFLYASTRYADEP